MISFSKNPLPISVLLVAPMFLTAGCGERRECTPTTCEAEGKNCGILPNGCGGQLQCGTCTQPMTCAGGGVPNVCGCTPESNEQFCFRLDRACRSFTAEDNCGQVRTTECGTCGGLTLCGGGGFEGKCAQPTTENLLGVAVNSPTDIWAVGANGTIVHYDGSIWSTVPSGTSNELRGIWMNETGTDGWIVGAVGTLLRYSGTTWSAAPTSPSSVDLNAVHGVGTNVWIAGDSGNLFQWDGTEFDNVPTDTTENLFAVHVPTATSDVYAAGGSVRIVYKDDTGNYVSTSVSSQSGGGTFNLRALWMIDETNGPLLYGGNGFGAWNETNGVTRWDGTAGVRGLWAPDTGNGFGVGARSGTGAAQFFRFSASGEIASRTAVPGGATLTAVSGKDTEVWGVGEAGAIVRLSP